MAQLPFLSAAKEPSGQIPDLRPEEKCGIDARACAQAHLAAERVGIVEENEVNSAVLRIGEVAGAQVL